MAPGGLPKKDSRVARLFPPPTAAAEGDIFIDFLGFRDGGVFSPLLGVVANANLGTREQLEGDGVEDGACKDLRTAPLLLTEEVAAAVVDRPQLTSVRKLHAGKENRRSVIGRIDSNISGRSLGASREALCSNNISGRTLHLQEK